MNSLAGLEFGTSLVGPSVEFALSEMKLSEMNR
jgi:hypothetical protein